MTTGSRVRKFRSIEEMNAATVDTGPGDVERFLRHCARYRAIAPRTYPRGVFKFRSIEDAQRARQQSARQEWARSEIQRSIENRQIGDWKI